MPVFNRRNAAIGWLALLFGKRLLKRKARAAAQAVDSEVRRPRHKAIAALVAAAVGAGALLRRRTGSDDDAS